MSKLMLMFGILFLSLGVALGFLIHFSPGQMQVVGLTPEVSAIFLVGGALCLGLGSMLGALRDRAMPAVQAAAPAEAASEKPATPKFTGFGKKAPAETAAVEVKGAVAEPAVAPKPSVADTISALEQAKSDIAVALGVETHLPSEPEPAPPKAEPAAAEASEAAELFVVEEKVIRGRPARILSDGTVEAETDEGWMRFENLEHLDEYLEAVVPDA